MRLTYRQIKGLMRIVYCLALVAMTITGSAYGQALHPPVRLFEGAPKVDLPRYPSIDAYMRAHPAKAGGLEAFVTPNDKATRTMERISVKSQAGRLAKAFIPDAQLKHVSRTKNGTVRWFEGRLQSEAGFSMPSKRASNANFQGAVFEEAARSVLRHNKKWLGIDNPDEELNPIDIHRDALGFVHARFEQVVDGIPVWGRDLYVHFNDQGEVYALNGMYEPSQKGLDAIPLVTAAGANDRVIAELKALDRWAPLEAEVMSMLDIELISNSLVWYPDENGGLALAYQVDVHPTVIEWYSYIVDAKTGQVLNKISQHCSIDHQKPLPPATSLSLNTSGWGSRDTFIDAQGVDLAGQTRAFRALSLDSGGFLLMSDLDNIPAGAQLKLIPDEGGSVVLTTNNKDLTAETSLDGIFANGATSWTDPSSVSAHVNAELIYDYYKTVHNRNAIDDKNQSLVSIIHVTNDGQPMDNASWNGRFMIYGDGNTGFTPLAEALDVAGHEITHGVIQHTAGLVYQFQPGALNESFADVFGVLVESEDFLLGEDISIQSQGIALRDLLNPDNPQVQATQPASMADFYNLTADQDNGGVHINSGIPNRAAALIIQGIGGDKTGQIYYRALTSYLNRNSQFGDARMAIEQATKDLHGDNSEELQIVRQSFDAVGIAGSSGSGGDEGNDVPIQTGGQSLIAFMIEDGSLGIVDVTNPENVTTGLFQGAGTTARTNPELNDFSQLSTTRDGETIWFINDQLKLAVLNVTSGEVSVFDDLSIQEEGDLWNASISPDGNFVALVSAYTEDPNLYIFDGQQLATIELKPEGTQEDIKIESIQYPDVVTWSPNPQIPRIAFDAFNVQALAGGESEEYWNIYELNFESSRIYELLPPQGNGVNVGNITYSNSDPDLVAFNLLEADKTEIAIGNFATGEITILNLVDQGVNNALRPSFAPDDKQLVFSNPTTNQLMFTDGNALSSLTFDISLYNPKWFVTGGSGGVQNQAPQASFFVSEISGVAPLELTFNASDSSDPEGGALTYNWDFGNGSTGGGETITHTFSQGGAFDVVLSVLDSGGLSSSASITITVEDPNGVSVESSGELPTRVALHQNYPNPFNPTTNIRFDLPVTSEVQVEVLDLLGRSVSKLLDGSLSAGTHEVSFDAGDLPSGVYMILLSTSDITETRKMVLMR
ncbi:MAG: M4 family metallopeptidase [Rhodothermales bacterium]